MTTHEIPSTSVLSLCGTASDMIVGLIFVVPCAVCEIFLCLEDMRKHATREVYLRCCVGAVLLFPLVFFATLLFLLYEIFSARTMLVLRYGNPTELLYETSHTTQHMESTKDVTQENSHIKLKVTVLRVELQKTPRLSTPDGRVSLEINEQRLVTPVVKCVKSTYSFTSNSDKTFSLLLNESDKDDKIVCISLFDTAGQCMGSCRESFENWVANGRFEGDLQLRDKSNAVIGKVFLVVKSSFFKHDIVTDPYQRSSVNYNRRPSVSLAPSQEGEMCTGLADEPMRVCITISAAEFAKRYERNADPSNKSYLAAIQLGKVQASTCDCISSTYRPVWDEPLTLELPCWKEVLECRNKFEISVLDSSDNVLGECAHWPAKWWSNGGLHFEGALDLFWEGLVVGHVFLTIKPWDNSIESTDKKLRRRSLFGLNSVKNAMNPSVNKQAQGQGQVDVGPVHSVLTMKDDEKERIFHGIQDEDNFFDVKNPYAFEMRSEMEHNLKNYAIGNLDMEMSSLSDRVESLRQNHEEISARMKSVDSVLSQVQAARAAVAELRLGSGTRSADSTSLDDQESVHSDNFGDSFVSLDLVEASELDHGNEEVS